MVTADGTAADVGGQIVYILVGTVDSGRFTGDGFTEVITCRGTRSCGSGKIFATGAHCRTAAWLRRNNPVVVVFP